MVSTLDTGKKPGRGSTGPEVLIGQILKKRGLTLAVAESCSGGMLSNMITNVPGSSEYFLGGVVAYSNDVKRIILEVRAETLKAWGAVSRHTAVEMAVGVRKKLKSDAGISITGIAGPGGGSPEKPVGTVFIGVSVGKKIIVRKFSFKGTRLSIKRRASVEALTVLSGLLMRGGGGGLQN